MTFEFGKRSLDNLNTCDARLQSIALEAIQFTPVDFAVISGFRDEAEQNKLVADGLSKTWWPTSKHNHRLVEPDGVWYPQSLAFDFAPYPIDWRDTHRFAVVAGVLMSVAKRLGHSLRWGGDFDGDGFTIDSTFMDWGHVELQ